jgi:hypothetical protein
MCGRLTAFNCSAALFAHARSRTGACINPFNPARQLAHFEAAVFRAALNNSFSSLRSEAIQNVSRINELWIATSLRASR